MCDKVAGSSPKGSRKGAMVKGGCFVPLKHEKPLKIKDFCVRVQNCRPNMAPALGLEPKTP